MARRKRGGLPQVTSTSISNQLVSILAREHYEILKSHYKERLRQSRMTSNVTITLLALGVMIVFAGAFLLFRNNITSGIATTASGIITDIIVGTVFKLNKDSNDRLDSTAEDMGYFERVRTSEALMDKITDTDKKNSLLVEVVTSMLKIDLYIQEEEKKTE